MHAASVVDPAARRSLRVRLTGGSLARGVSAADLRLFRLVRGDLHHPVLARRVAAFSRLGEHAACWLVVGAAGTALDPRRRAAWRRGLAAVTAAYVLNTVLKVVLRRKRPALEDLPALIATPTRLSFPSAHASSSFAAASAYGRLIPAGPLYAVATAMACSRVYLGVHYPSDIAAGAALGTVVGSLAR